MTYGTVRRRRDRYSKRRMWEKETAGNRVHDKSIYRHIVRINSAFLKSTLQSAEGKGGIEA